MSVNINNNLEDITIPGWELKEDGWYMESHNKDSSEPICIRVLPYFKIITHYFVGRHDEEFVEIVDENGSSTIRKVKRNSNTYLVNPELIKPYGYFDSNFTSSVKMFLTKYIEEVKVTRGTELKFLGYRFINRSWNITVGEDGKYSREDLGNFLYGERIDEPWFVPSVKGDLEIFKEIYHHAFFLDEPALHLAIAYYLSWIGEELLNSTMSKTNINPVLILLEDTETGKSSRLRIASGLYSNPDVFSFKNIRQEIFDSILPLIKAPIGIGEVEIKSWHKKEKLAHWIYSIANRIGKMTAYETYYPMEVPVILAGNDENFLVYNMFKTYRNLVRRCIVIKVRYGYKQYALDYLLDKLQNNYGHIVTYVKSLSKEDEDIIKKYKQDFYNKIQFDDDIFNDIREQLSLSFAMLKHFYKYFICLSEDIINKYTDDIIEFAVREITSNHDSKIQKPIDYAQEVMEFISSVLEAKENGEKLRGMSYKALLEKIDYKPSDKVGEMLKTFFWKRYYSRNYTSRTNLKFRDNSLLLIYPNYSLKDVIDEGNIIYDEFTKDKLYIWLRVAELRFGKEGVDSIKKSLVNIGV